MTKMLCVLLVLGGLACKAQAGSSDRGSFMSYDRGQDTCGQYLGARRNSPHDSARYSIWLAGFITAYNQQTPDSSDLISLQNHNDPTPMTGPMQWIENYCLKNPISYFMTAVVEFTKFQYPNRKH